MLILEKGEMEDFVASPIFKTYALCSALLLGKMMVLSIMTSRQRIKHGKFSNKEDAVAAGLKASNQYDLKVSVLVILNMAAVTNVCDKCVTVIIFILILASIGI